MTQKLVTLKDTDYPQGEENIPQKSNLQTAIYTFETLEEVEKEIDSLLEAQPDAQILSVFVDKGLYRVVERRHYGGWID